MSKQEAAACLAMILLIDDDEEKVTRGPTRNWMLKRGTEGLYWNLVQELMVEDTQTWPLLVQIDKFLDDIIIPINFYCFRVSHFEWNKQSDNTYTLKYSLQFTV